MWSDLCWWNDQGRRERWLIDQRLLRVEQAQNASWSKPDWKFPSLYLVKQRNFLPKVHSRYDELLKCWGSLLQHILFTSTFDLSLEKALLISKTNCSTLFHSCLNATCRSHYIMKYILLQKSWNRWICIENAIVISILFSKILWNFRTRVWGLTVVSVWSPTTLKLPASSYALVFIVLKRE